MKQKITTADSVQIHEVETDIAAGEEFIQEMELPDGFQKGVILVETLEGKVTVAVEGMVDEELSHYDRVKLRVAAFAANVESIVVKVNAKVTSTIRLSIVFINERVAEAIEKFPCKACKAACKLALSALFAHIGIPYLDAEASVSLPDVQDPNMPNLESFPENIGELGTHPTDRVEVAVGEPVNVSSCRKMLEDPESSMPPWLRDLFDIIHPEAIGAVRIVIGGVNWLFDATDTFYTRTCQRLKLCSE